MIALVVSVQVHEHKLDDFLTAIEQNAERTFNDEVGCRYFDVTQDVADPLHFIFYELYLDEAAIEAHRAAPHFAEWRKAAAECVVSGSQVNTLCTRLFHHSGADNTVRLPPQPSAPGHAAPSPPTHHL